MERVPPYREGTWFAVPLRTGGYGIGRVARNSGNGVAYGYFFGPCHESVPIDFDVISLQPSKAILKVKFGDLGLLNGEWPIISQIAEFERGEWPLLPFVRIDEVSGRAWMEIYTDKMELVSEKPCDPTHLQQYSESGLFGYGAVEKRLTRLLTNETAG